jgi:hypothetical protein
MVVALGAGGLEANVDVVAGLIDHGCSHQRVGVTCHELRIISEVR